MTDVTLLLKNLADGRPDAAAELFPVVYDELRRLAASFLRDERVAHTLQPTALVHEAYVRLATPSPDTPRSTFRFRALAATVMRHVLVDHARARASAKRGGERTMVAFSDAVPDSPTGAAIDIEAIDRALVALAAMNERTARVVELRFFGGLTAPEIATALDLSLSSVEREWRFARAWLSDRLSTGGGE